LGTDEQRVASDLGRSGRAAGAASTVLVDEEGVIHVHGDLDLASTEALSSVLVRANGPVCRLDLSGCSFVDVFGLRLLAQVAQQRRTEGSELVLVRPPRPLRRVMTLVDWPGIDAIRIEE
jgi:anti-anti-sigma factor